MNSRWGDIRWFDANYSIAIRTGVLVTVISRLKAGQAAWAGIAGRLLVGFVNEEWPGLEPLDLVVASPTFVGAGARHTVNHTGEVVRAAARESAFNEPEYDSSEPPAIVKTAETPTMQGFTHQQRKANAYGPLREALTVPDPSRVSDRIVAVYDDVFTGGHTLNEVARALRLAGARRVIGISLGRQIYSK